MTHSHILKLFPYPATPLRILVVDDQAINVHAINEIFKDDYEVLMATDGLQAIKICNSQYPDLVLLDVIMPEMSGHEVCLQITNNPATEHIPIIFVTSQDQDIDESFAFEIGAVDFITKPINPVTVQARVKTHLALKLQNDFLRSIAHIDGLTGVFNRRRFDEDLELSWKQCLREQQPLSLILIDLDQFKRFNDHYGHVAGDACLRSIAQALKEMPHRPRDLFARYGGEEFGYILPNTPYSGALHCANRILEITHALQIEHLESDASDIMTISMGVATIQPTKELSPTYFIEQTDKALYQAKENGRDQFVSIDLNNTNTTT